MGSEVDELDQSGWRIPRFCALIGVYVSEGGLCGGMCVYNGEVKMADGSGSVSL